MYGDKDENKDNNDNSNNIQEAERAGGHEDDGHSSCCLRPWTPPQGLGGWLGELEIRGWTETIQIIVLLILLE